MDILRIVALGLLAVSISESVFLERHSLNWVVFVLGVTRIAVLRRRAALAQRPPAYVPRPGAGYATTH